MPGLVDSGSHIIMAAERLQRQRVDQPITGTTESA